MTTYSPLALLEHIAYGLRLKIALFLDGLPCYTALHHGYSAFFLLHGREMVTPVNENLRAKIPKPTQGPVQLNESLKSCLRQAYKAVAKANRRSHMANMERYDRRALMSEIASTSTTQLGSQDYLKSFILCGPTLFR